MIHLHDAIERGETLMQPTSALEVNGRALPVVDKKIKLDDGTRKQVQQLAHCAIGAMKREDTLVGSRFNLPTLVARLDCTVQSGEVIPYELDERPAGIGITANLLGQDFYATMTDHYERIIGEVPMVIADQNEISDDSLVFQVAGLTDSGDSPCLVRASPVSIAQHPNVSEITARSVSSVLLEGDKTYSTIAEGYRAQPVTPNETVDPTTSTVIKPRQGSKAVGVHVYLSPKDRATHGKRGIVTASKMNKLLSQDIPQVKEPFAPPIVLRDQNGTVGNMILRVFVLVKPQEMPEVIGGAFVIRRELVVHGASNAIAGGIIV